MKFGITFTLMMIALSLSSQSFTEDIEVKHFISVKSNLIASDNLDLTTNLSIDQLKNTPTKWCYPFHQRICSLV